MTVTAFEVYATGRAAPRTSSGDDRLTIFVIHPSHLLTDHLPHGDGLLAHSFLRLLAERGHRLHVAVEHMSLAAPIPGDVHLYPMARPLRVPGVNRFAYMAHVRAVLRAVQRRERVDVAHQLNPVTVGLSLGVVGSGVPVVLGPIVPIWAANAGQGAAGRLRGMVRDAVRWPVGRVMLALQQAPADALLLSSPAARERVVAPGRLAGRLHDFPFGVDAETFAPTPAAERESDGAAGATEPTVLFLANLEPQKGIFTLLDAVDPLLARVPTARVVIAGGGSAEGAVRARVARLARPERVTLIGRVAREQVPAVMRDAAVYCLPSLGEPFGMTAVEAMACGVPVVVSAAGGLQHLVPADGGVLVPPGDAGALAEALAGVLTDPTRRRAMGAANRRHVEARFAWPRVIDRLEGVYRTLVNRPP